MIEILAVSGSLRRASINTALVRSFVLAAPEGVRVTLFSGIGDLPLFNPDIEHVAAPSVDAWRAALAASDGAIIASPEYAHGIPGAMKNALDWVVGTGEFVGKPVALLNAAPRSSIAFQALAEVMRTMDARLVTAASLDIPVLGRGLEAEGILADPDLAARVRRSTNALVNAIVAQASGVQETQ